MVALVLNGLSLVFLCKLQFLLVEHSQISHSCLQCASLSSYLSKNFSNGMHCIMIVKSAYVFQTIFLYVLVAPTNIVRESSLYNLCTM